MPRQALASLREYPERLPSYGVGVTLNSRPIVSL
jgi:hypothetical protein